VWVIVSFVMTTHAYVWKALYFARVLSFFFFGRYMQPKVTERNSTKLCHMFGS